MTANQDHLAALSGIYHQSCQEVFETLNGSFQKIENIETLSSEYSAHIEASSDDLELIMVLKGPVSFLEETHPLKQENASVDEEQLIDWIAELANRFMGSLKNHLIPYDHTLKLDIPKNQLSSYDQSRPLSDYVPFSLHYGSDNGVFESSLYIKVLNPDIAFELNPSMAANDSEVEDGELEMF